MGRGFAQASGQPLGGLCEHAQMCTRRVGGGEDFQQSRFSPPETHRLPPFLDFPLTGFTTMQSDSNNYFYFFECLLVLGAV